MKCPHCDLEIEKKEEWDRKMKCCKECADYRAIEEQYEKELKRDSGNEDE